MSPPRPAPLYTLTPAAAVSSIQCKWDGCTNYWAVVDNLIFDEVPLCLAHVYRTWELAQQVADVTENREPTAEVVAAGTVRTAARPVSRLGWIYYLRVGDHIKIGYTANLRQRITTGYPPNAVFLGAHRGTLAQEQTIHGLLYLHCAMGAEWYDPHPEVLEFIDAAIAEHVVTPDPRRERPSGRQPVQPRKKAATII